MVRRCRIVLINLSDPPAGWNHDIAVYTQCLAALGVDVLGAFGWSDLPRIAHQPVTINIFLEELPIDAAWFASATVNWFMLNQDIAHNRQHYSRLDKILCKTRFAHNLLSKLEQGRYVERAFYTGFSSPDRWTNEAASFDSVRFGRILFVPGKALWKKNALVVWQTWKRNPHFPLIICIMRLSPTRSGVQFPFCDLPNLRIISEWVEDAELTELQKTCGVHLCPSRSEGFGHQLNESRGVGAVTITVAKPPMNELVDESIGILIPAIIDSEAPETFPGARACNMSVADLESAMQRYLSLSLEAKAAMGRRAQIRFRSEREAFVAKMDECLRTIDS